MSEPFLGEIIPVAFSFAPKGWALCNGQLLPINQNQALFSLLGTTYGGDGRTTFALPNLQGCAANMVGSGFALGQRGGEELHTLTMQEMPVHQHQVLATATAASSIDPNNNVLAVAPVYISSPPDTAAGQMGTGTISVAGASQPHENRQPFLVLNYIIALQGIFPSQN